MSQGGSKTKVLQRAFASTLEGLHRGEVKEYFPCMKHPRCCFLCYVDWLYLSQFILKEWFMSM